MNTHLPKPRDPELELDSELETLRILVPVLLRSPARRSTPTFFARLWMAKICATSRLRQESAVSGYREYGRQEHYTFTYTGKVSSV